MANSSPYDGTGWNADAPDVDQIVGNVYQEAFDLRRGVALRINKEHETLAASSAGGVLKQGSARCFFQDAAPTTQVNGDAFDAGNLGSLWFDSNSAIDNVFSVLTATTPTWTPVSTEIIATLLAANRQFAGTLTVDLATTLTGAVGCAASITLGAGADLIGSATSDITFATNKFTVAGATGNTLIAGTLNVTGVMTTTAASVLGDGSTLAAATETGDGDRTIVDLAYAKTGDTVQHDAEGGYSNCDVDGTKAKVYTKYLTGTLDADANTTVAHGVTGIDKILAVTAYAFSTDSGGRYQVGELYTAAGSTITYQTKYDGTNVYFVTVGSTLQSQKYRIKIDYIL